MEILHSWASGPSPRWAYAGPDEVRSLIVAGQCPIWLAATLVRIRFPEFGGPDSVALAAATHREQASRWLLGTRIHGYYVRPSEEFFQPRLGVGQLP